MRLKDVREHRIYDVVRYRLHRMKKKLKDELDSRNTIQQYICPNCGKRYSAFDALQLVSMIDEYFHCENCNGELIAESDKFAVEEMGDGDDNVRRRRREKLRDMLQKMEVAPLKISVQQMYASVDCYGKFCDLRNVVPLFHICLLLISLDKACSHEQLKPLMTQLARVKDLAVPEFGGLLAWEARVQATARVIGDSNASDSKSSLGQGYGGTPMPFLGETRVEVALPGMDVKEEDTGLDTKSASMKVLPPWMIKKGMVLTKEQRGEVKAGIETAQSLYTMDEKKPGAEKEEGKNIQASEAYGFSFGICHSLFLWEEQEAASRKMQEVAETYKASTAEFSNGIGELTDRQVGMKSKRENDENDDVYWEESTSTAMEALRRESQLKQERGVSELTEDSRVTCRGKTVESRSRRWGKGGRCEQKVRCDNDVYGVGTLMIGRGSSGTIVR
ncbi:hypothetical protein KSP40_PGU004497 [Platanthera guangdongensis]|uniref:Transcription initiation factor IIE subunit alpha N-terminal domain-containing protein n=1 Tax=Platanthera guangdongensis TaxID=2320717 RepID=A0ABR2MFF5_9ASPA